MNTWIYKVLVVVAVIITTWVLEVNGAYQHLPCPSVCRSLKFQSIQYVYCNSTGIQEVPRGIPPNTELLDLSYTMIQSIPKDAFIGLVNLGELDLSSNGLKDDNIADGALDLPKLVTVDLSSNRFTSIPSSLPQNITKLWFMQNSMVTLKSDCLVKYTALNYLDVSNNQMLHIEPMAFNSLINLQTL